MENKKKRQDKKLSVKILGILLSFCLIVAMLPPVSAAAEENVRKLKNGSFEEGQTFTKDYLQTPTVDNWNTTAFQGKFELFRDNSNTYLTNPNVRLTPTDGTYAAELNADEESTLYQNVKTTSSSVYEWGLDHGARNGKDIMALVIGPAQNKPDGTSYLSKPSKDGRDQFMQMVDWLNIDNSTITAGAEPKQYTVYSKKFAASGAFADNAGNNAFSLTPSTIYTEEWHIWIMASKRGKDTSKPNPWNSYGSNAAGSAGSSDGSGSTTVDLSKYYLYTVPAGQTETLFGFVSVGYVDSPTTADKAKTYGNFLDRINFQLYHPLSGSTTTHGSAVVGGSDGTSGGTGGSSEGHKVTVNDKLATYVTDGDKLKIQAIVKKADADAGCEFVGVYDTTQDENGNPKTVFLQLEGNVIEDTGSLTDEQKKGKWIKSTNTDGDTVYTYYLENLTSATDLHFVFIKNPTITYDPNGGKDYVVERIYNTNEAPNVYSFKPAVLTGNTGGVDTTTGATNKPTEWFIPPCVSHAAEGQNDGWKFMGWLLTGDKLEKTGESETHVNEDQLGKLILPDVHTIACNYSVRGATEETAAQHFNIYNGKVSLTKILNKTENAVTSVTWKDNGEERAYANDHKGLTMIAQWRWRQAFIPQVGSGTTFTNSADGGTVEITSVTNTSDANYNAAYNANGGKSYHAETDETITVTATEKDGFTFEGWYDASGKLVTTNTTYSYTETKESVNTYYARFSGSVTQTYIRQVKNGDTWEDTTDDKIGTLGRYKYIDAPGMPISSTAAAGSGYKFVGWYDSTGNKVADTMLINDGATISYTTTGNATYYARFEIVYNPTVENKVYLSFVSESADVNIPSAFDGRDAGIHKNTERYGLEDGFGNTISTGFQYSLNTMTDVSTIQITVTVPASAYVKVGGTGSFTGNGTSILTDSAGVTYNKGSIQQISGATTLTYYWDASGLQAGTTYGFIIDNLYAPGATATITVNGTAGTKVTNDNGVVNTASGEYRGKSHYPQ